jgi:hypothetical protein
MLFDPLTIIIAGVKKNKEKDSNPVMKSNNR